MNQLLGCKLEFNNHSVKLAGSFEDRWYCGSDLTSCLGYGVSEDAIRVHVKRGDQCSLRNLLEDKHFKVHELREDLDCIYVNVNGAYSLAHTCEPEIYNAFMQWDFNVVIPFVEKMERSYLQLLIDRVMGENEDMRAKNNELEHANNMLGWACSVSTFAPKVDLPELRNMAKEVESENEYLRVDNKYLQMINKELLECANECVPHPRVIVRMRRSPTKDK